jgi:hypothetical protein
MQMLRQARIIQMAMMEGVCLLGIVFLLLHQQNGMLSSNSLYWLTAAPVLAFVISVAFLFPTEERLADIYRSKKEQSEMIV